MILSSIQYKENVKPIRSESDNVQKLRPVVFNYKSDSTKAKTFGLIAEEVDEFYPSLVVRDPYGGVLTVKYQELPILLLSEIQKLYTRIDHLESLLKI